MVRTWGIATSLVWAATANALAADEPGDFSYFVGQRVCLECHAPPGNDEPCSYEDVHKHAKSYDLLSKLAAPNIAALSGIFTDPRESRICLGCHATSAEEGPRWTRATFHIEDGVQCESCHGPGSLHTDAAFASRPSLGAKTNPWIRAGDRNRCADCHVKRASHQEVLESGFKLAPEDREYKTPVSLAVAPDGARLYVVCQQSDSLIVVDLAREKVVKEIAVGRRPHGVAISADGRSVFVSNRLSDTLSVIDADRLEVVSEIPVGHDPHGVRCDSTGDRVVVANTGENTVSVVNVAERREEKRLVAGAGPWSVTASPDRGAFLVTNVRPNLGRFRDPPVSEITVVDAQQLKVIAHRLTPEANMMTGIAAAPSRNIALFTLLRTKNLIPITRVAQGWVITNGLGVLRPSGRIDQVLLDEPDAYFADPTAVAIDPTGRYALVTGGGVNEAAVVDVDRLLSVIDEATEQDRTEVLPNHLGTSGRFVVKRLAVGRNPRDVVYRPDGRFAYVANALDDTVSVLDTSDYAVTKTIELGGPDGVTQLRLGERLFHSAEATFARQFSCRGCHPDGHDNGLTFDIEADGLGQSPVDNRSLRGVMDTAPFKWEGTNPTLVRQCGPRFAMFFTRTTPYTLEQVTALARYEGTIEELPNRHRSPDGLSPRQRRGKALFDRIATNDGTSLAPTQQCAFCHAGPYRTNHRTTSVGTVMWFDDVVDVPIPDLFDADEFGDLGSYYFIDVGTPALFFDVPHLRNLSDTAPYLHNGGANTLEEIWTRFNMTNRHGVTSDLTREQFNDLMAYLRAL